MFSLVSKAQGPFCNTVTIYMVMQIKIIVVVVQAPVWTFASPPKKSHPSIKSHFVASSYGSVKIVKS